jgi:hypothetical protein
LITLCAYVYMRSHDNKPKPKIKKTLEQLKNLEPITDNLPLISFS